MCGGAQFSNPDVVCVSALINFLLLYGDGYWKLLYPASQGFEVPNSQGPFIFIFCAHEMCLSDYDHSFQDVMVWFFFFVVTKDIGSKKSNITT